MCNTNRGWCLTLLLIISSVVMAVLCHPLNNSLFPMGMLDFELAKTAETAAAIMASWQGISRDYAIFSIGYDYLYMLIYTAWLAWAVMAVAHHFYGLIGRMGDVVGRVVWLAVLFDAIEDYGLIRQLFYGASDSLANMAYNMAVLKFAVIVAALAYIMLAGGGILLRKIKQ